MHKNYCFLSANCAPCRPPPPPLVHRSAVFQPCGQPVGLVGVLGVCVMAHPAPTAPRLQEYTSWATPTPSLVLLLSASRVHGPTGREAGGYLRTAFTLFLRLVTAERIASFLVLHISDLQPWIHGLSDRGCTVLDECDCSGQFNDISPATGMKTFLGLCDGSHTAGGGSLEVGSRSLFGAYIATTRPSIGRGKKRLTVFFISLMHSWKIFSTFRFS